MIRSLLASAWMEIQHDLAWTTPAASLLLRVVSPFAAAMTTCIIYWFGGSFGGAGVTSEYLAFILVGSILYAHVASYAWVPTVAVAEGKNLSVFPHIYLTSRSTALYVTGRGLSACAMSAVTSFAALGIAFYTLRALPLVHTTPFLVVNPLSVAMVIGAIVADIPAALGLGYLLGAYSLYASKFEWSLPGYVAGLLMVFSGALFSTSILPWPLSTGASYLPYTLFIRAARDALIYSSYGDYVSSMALCIAGGAILMCAGLGVYFVAEKKARRDGVIDRRFA